MSRRMMMAGRSVSRINGETVPISLLKEAAAILIDIHGQHEHQSLLYRKNHLGITDAYARESIEKEKEETQSLFHAYKALKELEDSQTDEAQRAKNWIF